MKIPSFTLLSTLLATPLALAAVTPHDWKADDNGAADLMERQQYCDRQPWTTTKWETKCTQTKTQDVSKTKTVTVPKWTVTKTQVVTKPTTTTCTKTKTVYTKTWIETKVVSTTTKAANCPYPPQPITITKPGVTVTKPGECQTNTVTVPVTIPGADGEVVTVTIPTTVTLPGEETTVTVPITIPGGLTTITVPTTTTETATITATETTTTATTTTEIQTQTTTATTTTTELSTTTTTTTTTTTAPATAPAPACPDGQVVRNGGFEAPLPGSWTILSAGDSTLERSTAHAAPGGTSSFRSRISAANPNLPQRLIQAITVCPGWSYSVSFLAMKATSIGTVSATLYINDVPVRGGLIDTTWLAPAPMFHGPGIFSTGAANSVILRMEFEYAGGAGAEKEVFVDGIELVRMWQD